MTLNESSLCKVIPGPVPSAMPPFHNTEKEGTLMTLKLSSLGPGASLNPEIWCFSSKWPQALWPKASGFMILLLNSLKHHCSVWMLKLQSHWSCSSLSTGLPLLFCGPALWIQGSLSAWKAPEFRYGSLWLCSTEEFIIHNLLKSFPQQLPKIPLVRNAIMRRSGCFVTHTVSLKRFFFLKQIFSRRIQRFFQSYSKHRTAHTISQRSAAS